MTLDERTRNDKRLDTVQLNHIFFHLFSLLKAQTDTTESRLNLVE